MIEIIRRGLKGKIRALSLLVVFSFLLYPFSFMADASAEQNDWKKEQGKDLPLMVTSDRMVSSQKENKIFFYGNVVAVRGDVTLHSDELEVYNTPKENKTEKIIARGHVVIDSKDRHATGHEATYYEVTQRIILTGNPKAWENNNEIVGDEMIFLVNEDKFIVNSKEQKGQQIKLIFYPGEEKGEKEKKDGDIKEKQPVKGKKER